MRGYGRIRAAASSARTPTTTSRCRSVRCREARLEPRLEHQPLVFHRVVAAGGGDVARVVEVGHRLLALLQRLAVAAGERVAQLEVRPVGAAAHDANLVAAAG